MTTSTRPTAPSREEVQALYDLLVPGKDFAKTGAQILQDLGVRKMRLMTNNPKKIVGLEGYGLEIVERVPLEIEPNEVNRQYLQTKRDKLGHFIESVSGNERIMFERLAEEHTERDNVAAIRHGCFRA